MARSLERRIARLQAQRAAAVPRMLAWQDTGEPGIDADTVQLCAIGAGGERMTRRRLERRLAALESARTPDDGMYVVDIGGEPESGADVVQK